MFAEAFTDPIAAFLAAWSRVRDTAPHGFDPSTVTLATADTAGRPAARMVLLKGADERGFIFFTNYSSRKAQDLDANPRAAMCFFWHWLGQQVRVEGVVQRVSAGESDEYFATRPRGSQREPGRRAKVRRSIPWRLWRPACAKPRLASTAATCLVPCSGGYRLEPDTLSHDQFLWEPVVRAEGGGDGVMWSAKAEFDGPRPAPLWLAPWEQYAQVLILANEFAFVD